jgi:BirA family biotin operon repressor/biotin-[acetyl-CoA-carboxylase] ligase
VEHLDHVDSTNTWLARRAREGATGHHAVYCDFQSEGRGRLDRVWRAPAGSSLLCSALLATPPTPVAPQWVVVAAALSVCDALDVLSGRRPTLKWPNDVLFDEGKVAGLLAEVVATESRDQRNFASDAPHPRSDMVVVGLGLNLHAVDPHYAGATTVLEATGASLEPAGVLDAYLDALGERRASLDTAAGRASLRERYLEELATLGRDVRVELVGGVVRGRAVGIDEDGALIVDTGDERRTFAAGDVVHLRGEES